jgi:hypothetical protein
MVWPSPLKFISKLYREAKALLEAALTDANRVREEKILKGTKYSQLSPHLHLQVRAHTGTHPPPFDPRPRSLGKVRSLIHFDAIPLDLLTFWTRTSRLGLSTLLLHLCQSQIWNRCLSMASWNKAARPAAVRLSPVARSVQKRLAADRSGLASHLCLLHPSRSRPPPNGSCLMLPRKRRRHPIRSRRTY